jgi:hypothetical protein
VWSAKTPRDRHSQGVRINPDATFEKPALQEIERQLAERLRGSNPQLGVALPSIFDAPPHGHALEHCAARSVLKWLSEAGQQVGQDIYLQPMSSGAKQVVEIREISRRECPCTWSDDDG